MHLRTAAAVLALLLASFGATIAKAGDLAPGSPAPALDIKEWLKGDRIERIDPAKTYVVELWATWCGPCVESIPHLTALAKKHEDVAFLGVSVLEESKDGNIKRFVDRMGDKMAYRVAHSGNKDGMAASWLKAASQDGIPTAFIVKGGVIQWIGHPNELDKPLAELAAGTFDVAASKEAFEASLRAVKARQDADAAVGAAMALRDAGKKQEASAALGDAAKKYPRLADDADRIRWEWLADDAPEAWMKETESLAASGNPKLMQRVASFGLRSAQKPETADRARACIALVLKASASNDWDILLYARTIYLKLGDSKDALAATTRMLELFPTSPAKDNAELREALLKSKSELESKVAKPS